MQLGETLQHVVESCESIDTPFRYLQHKAIYFGGFVCSTKRGGLPDGGLISEGTAEPIKRTKGRTDAKISQ